MEVQRTNRFLFSLTATFLPGEAICVFVVMSSLIQHTLQAEKKSMHVVSYEIPVAGDASGHGQCWKVNVIPAL